MQVTYNVTGERRKELVRAVSQITDSPVRYLGMPSAAYVVSDYIIDRDGTLSLRIGMDVDKFEWLLGELYMRGFLYEARENDLPEPAQALESGGPQPAVEHIDQDGFTIGLPLTGFTDAQILNLERLVASKAALLKKALGADTLLIERTEDRLQFPWFSRIPNAEEVNTYSSLIIALVEMAKRQKRINATAHPVDSERFAFRIFLLRLGFGGPEHAAKRKLLLKNLCGPSAFPSAAKADAHTARWTERRRQRRTQLTNQVDGDGE